METPQESKFVMDQLDKMRNETKKLISVKVETGLKRFEERVVDKTNKDMKDLAKLVERIRQAVRKLEKEVLEPKNDNNNS